MSWVVLLPRNVIFPKPWPTPGKQTNKNTRSYKGSLLFIYTVPPFLIYLVCIKTMLKVLIYLEDIKTMPKVFFKKKLLQASVISPRYKFHAHVKTAGWGTTLYTTGCLHPGPHSLTANSTFSVFVATKSILRDSKNTPKDVTCAIERQACLHHDNDCPSLLPHPSSGKAGPVPRLTSCPSEWFLPRLTCKTVRKFSIPHIFKSLFSQLYMKSVRFRRSRKY